MSKSIMRGGGGAALKPLCLATALAALSLQAGAATTNHTLFVPVPALVVKGAGNEPRFVLDAANMPYAVVGQAYEFDHAPLLKALRVPDFNASAVTWQASGLPAGITMTKSGQLQGVPTTRNLQGVVSVTASFGTFSASRNYDLAVMLRQLSVTGTTDQGEVDLGANGSTQLVVTNTGDLEAAPGRPVVVSEPAGLFTLDRTDCAGTLQPQQACQAEIVFKPSAPGVGVGAFTLPEATIAVKGATLAGFGRQLSASLAAGEVPAVSINSAMEFPVTLRNDGNVAITVDHIALNALVGEGFSFVESSCPSKLAAGASCTVVLLFNPLKTGEHKGTLTVNTQAGAKTASFTGEGVVSNLAMAPFVGNIGAAQMGSSAVSEFIILSNSGGAPATGVALSVTDPKFSVVQSTCAATIPTNSSCKFKVSYKPDDIGVRRATLRVTSGQSQATMPISATGREVSAALQTPKNAIQAWYLSAMEFQLALFNYGSGPLEVYGVEPAEFRAEYSRVPAKDTCKKVLASGESCNFTFRFEGLTPGAVPPVAFIADTDAGQIQSAVMPASVLRTKINFAVAEVNFGKVLVGEKATSAPVRVSNTGNSGTVSYKLPPDVSVVESSCPASGTNFPLNTSCNMTFQFSPKAAGTLAQNGEWSWTGGKDGNTLMFKGVAEESTVPFTSATDFGWVDLGYPETLMATVSNFGGTAIDITSKTLSGSSAFALASGGTCGNTLAAGSTCTQALSFGPSVRGEATASLTMGSLAPASVKGKGAQAILSFTNTEIAFGERQIDIDNSNRANLRTTLVNSGDPTKLLTRGEVPLGYATAGCMGNLTEASPSCELIVSLYPERLADKLDQLNRSPLTFTAGPNASATVYLSMTPVLPRVEMTTPVFTDTAMGSLSSASITLTNKGVYRALLGAPVIAGNSTEFFYNSSRSNCDSTLAFKGTCTMVVDFMPVDSGVRPEGQFKVDLGSGVVLSVPLSAKGQ